MGLKRLARPGLLPLWVALLALAVAALVYQMVSVEEEPQLLPVPDSGQEPQAPGPVPLRDDLSPFKDGTGL